MSSEKSNKENPSFLEIDAKTRSSLQEFFPLAARVLPDILQSFYDHVAKHPELANMFGADEKLQREGMAHAAGAQARHWKNLFAGKFDAAYVDSVHKIGRAHSIKGLDPRWYIGGYAFIMNRLYEIIVRTYSSLPQRDEAQTKTTEIIRAVNQAVMLDMALAISVYNEENKRTYNQKLDELTNELESSIVNVANSLSLSAKDMITNTAALTKIAQETKQRLFQKKTT